MLPYVVSVERNGAFGHRQVSMTHTLKRQGVTSVAKELEYEGMPEAIGPNPDS